MAVQTVRQEIEEELFKKGWATKLFGISIRASIEFEADSFVDPKEREDFLKVAKEILAEKNIPFKTKAELEAEEKLRLSKERKSRFSKVEDDFLKESWPVSLDTSKNLLENVFFEVQCKEKYPEERRDFTKIAKKVLAINRK